MIAERVRRACRTVGSRNAPTPLLTASTPVIAVHPLANARIRSQKLAPVVATGKVGGANIAAGAPLEATDRARPNAITPSSEATNRYVGTTNARPASRTPGG